MKGEKFKEMKINLIFTVIYILILIFSLYFQTKLSKDESRIKKLIIPSLILISIVLIWIMNDFDVMNALPVTIILFMICIIDLLVTLFIHHKAQRQN